MTPDEAADLAARTLAAIRRRDSIREDWHPLKAHHAADRERVASDLAGLLDTYEPHLPMEPGDRLPARAQRHALRYADGLRRTAALYPVTSDLPPIEPEHEDAEHEAWVLNHEDDEDDA